MNVLYLTFFIRPINLFNHLSAPTVSMAVNIIQVILGSLLVLFLPGWTMINLMFPRKGELDEEFDHLYRATLGMAMSIAVVILVGFVLANPGLGYAPHPDPDIDDDGSSNDEDADVDGDGVPNDEEQLFLLQPVQDYDKYLAKGAVAANLSAAFETNGHTLTDAARMVPFDETIWRINDGNFRYHIENTSTELTVTGEDRDDDNDGIIDADDDSPQAEVKGYFQFRYIVPTLISITALFFVGGWWRGAYPWLGRLHPNLARAPPGVSLPAEEEVADVVIPEQLIRIHGLKTERRRVKEKLKLTERKMKAATGSMKAYYTRQQKVLVEDLADIDGQLADLESGAARPVQEALDQGTSEVDPEPRSEPEPELDLEPDREPDHGTEPEAGDTKGDTMHEDDTPHEPEPAEAMPTAEEAEPARPDDLES